MDGLVECSTSAFGGAPSANVSGAEVTDATCSGRPAVVIVDDTGCEYFHQLACTLRRRGFTTIKLQGGAPGPSRFGQRILRRWRDHLMYDVHISRSEVAGSLQEALGANRILDVLASETTLATIAPTAPILSEIERYGLAFAALPPHRLIDKFEVNAILERAGVRIPPQVRADAVSAEQAAEILGLPLIVKAAVGAAGAGVRIANSLAEVERAVSELVGGDRGRAFYQKYIDGEMVMYGAVSGEDGPLFERGLVVQEVQWRLGPSARIRLFDDADLLSAGRLAVSALGCRGCAEIGFLRDANGALWHVDANCRPWGNMISLLSIGIDFTEAYMALLLGRPHRSPPAAQPGGAPEDVSVLPFALCQAASSGSVRQAWSYAAPFTRMCRRGPGLRYAASIGVKVIGAFVSGALSRRARRLGATAPRLGKASA